MKIDRTLNIEKQIQTDNPPKLKYLFRLWKYVISSASFISLLYLGLYILLSLSKPLLAYIWNRYIDIASTPAANLLHLVSLLVAYYIINLVSSLILRYVKPMEQIERLDVVQSNRFQEKINTKIFRKFSSLNPELWEIPRTNDKVKQITSMVDNNNNNDSLSTSIMMQSYIIIAKLVSILSIAASLYIIHPLLAFIVIVAPLPTFFSSYLNEKSSFNFRKKITELSRKTNYYQNVMLKSGTKEIKSMGLFDFFYNKWLTQIKVYDQQHRKLIFTKFCYNLLQVFLANIASIFASIFAIVLMSQGHITLGGLGAVLSLVSVLLIDFVEFIKSFSAFLSKKNEAALFFDIMDIESCENIIQEESEDITHLHTSNIKYRYPLNNKFVLDGISLDIHKGEQIAFVGENGAGKTTFVKLILGLITPTSGDLTLNNQFIDDDVPSLTQYKLMSTVMQNPARYTTFTVKENVFLGDTLREKDNDRIDFALEFSEIGNIDKNMLLGKDIGGSDLSGGQWQKLAIAKAMYRNKNFIILDEPTSNLDPIAEKAVFQKYMDLAKDKTVIFVTHRISVASLAQRIVVFDKGKVVEDGTHEELIQNNGLYSTLYNEQAKWYDR